MGHLRVSDIDNGRAHNLADKFAKQFGADRISVAEGIDDEMKAAEGLVNATPIGMTGHPGTPAPTALLRPDMWVADIIYTPPETVLLAAARHCGARHLNGGAMVVFQAAEAMRLFTGDPVDGERMLADYRSLARK